MERFEFSAEVATAAFGASLSLVTRKHRRCNRRRLPDARLLVPRGPERRLSSKV